MHKLFVYGTLKKGFSNHHFLKGAKFLGKAITKHKYALYETSIPYAYPYEKVSPIRGELYEVDTQTIRKIDLLEGHPHAYRREKVPVLLENGEEVFAWIYFYPRKRGKLNPSGEFQPR